MEKRMETFKIFSAIYDYLYGGYIRLDEFIVEKFGIKDKKHATNIINKMKENSKYIEVYKKLEESKELRLIVFRGIEDGYIIKERWNNYNLNLTVDLSNSYTFYYDEDGLYHDKITLVFKDIIEFGLADANLKDFMVGNLDFKVMKNGNLKFNFEVFDLLDFYLSHKIIMDITCEDFKIKFN